MLKLICDVRERMPLDFSGMDCVVERGTLTTGDYGIRGLENCATIERKSLDDLVGCLMGDNRQRFERELARARGLELFAVMVESSWEDLAKHRYKSRMQPHAAAQSVIAFQVRYGTSFIFAGSRRAAAYLTFSLLEKFVAEQEAKLKAIAQAVGAA